MGKQYGEHASIIPHPALTVVQGTDISSFAGGGQLDPASLRVNPAGFDPVLGRTYAELGLEARSMHKCQGTSQLLLLPGAQQARVYKLTDTVLGQPGVMSRYFAQCGVPYRVSASSGVPSGSVGSTSRLQSMRLLPSHCLSLPFW